jgi:hypothetical protein
MKYAPLLAMLIVLAGCQHSPTIPTEVKIPVAVPCTVETPAEPAYQFGNLTPEDTIWTKVQVLLSDRQLSIAYETELKAALAACK